MKTTRIQARLKTAATQTQWRVPSELKDYVCSNDEIIERTKHVKGNLAALVIQARRGLNGSTAR